jgi:hypothetical protein
MGHDSDTGTITLDEAATYTWYRLSLEHDPAASHGLSADTVAATDNGEPIVSVIHVADRRHWNLTVTLPADDHDHSDPDPEEWQCVPAWDKDDYDWDNEPKFVPAGQLAAELLAGPADGAVFRVTGSPVGDWLLTVSVLPPAKS